MSFQLPFGVRILNPVPVDNKYFNSAGQPYTGTSQVFAQLPVGIRHKGLTVNINNEEYWFKTGTTNTDLVLKVVDVAEAGGITGATNGLTKVGSDVKLGGTLTGNTLIDLGAVDAGITISGSSDNTIDLNIKDIGQIKIDSSGVKIRDGIDSGGVEILTQYGFYAYGSTGYTSGVDIEGTNVFLYGRRGTFQVNGENLDIVAKDAGNFARTNIRLSSTNAYFKDDRTGTTANGLQYFANYSANFTPRSLVDKGYVTGLTSGLQSNIDNKLDTSIFNGYTGTTAPATYLSITNFNAYSGVTLTNINSRLLTSTFNSYTATTQPVINGAITGATNGLTKVGRVVELGGTLVDDTVVNTGGFQLDLSGTTGEIAMTIAGNHLMVDDGGVIVQLAGSNTFEYANDYSLNYVDRSLVDKAYVDNVAAGLDVKEASHVATTAPLTGATYNPTGGIAGTGSFTNAPTVVDGHTLEINDRILVKNQTDARQNGIYYWVSGTTWWRTEDQNGVPAAEVSPGNFTFVTTGNTLAGTGWIILGTGGTLTLNVDDINWTQFNAATLYTGGQGIVVTGGTIINVDLGTNSGLFFDGGKLEVDPNIAGNGLTFNSGVLAVGAANGLTSLGNNVVLGGTLTGNTTISSIGGETFSVDLSGTYDTLLSLDPSVGIQINSEGSFGDTYTTINSNKFEITRLGLSDQDSFITLDNNKMQFLKQSGSGGSDSEVDIQANYYGYFVQYKDITAYDKLVRLDLNRFGSTTEVYNDAAASSLLAKFVIGTGATTYTDSRGTTTGIQYVADYRSGYTNRTLVDKEYVDDKVATGATVLGAANGLSLQSGNVVLGGTLTGNTEIFGAGNTIYLGDAYDSSMLEGFRVSTSGNTGIELNSNYITVANVNNPTFAGIEYAANYASDFTLRSLVDKEYVDNLSLSGVTTNSITWLGYYAGNNAPIIGTTFIGVNAGNGATNSVVSTFIGVNAGYGATNSSSSTFIGANAGYDATDANESTFVGSYAGYEAELAFYSTFIGSNAGRGATSANSSTFIGFNAGENAGSVYGSIFVGRDSARNATNAWESTFIGNYAGESATNASNSTFIGYNAGESATNAYYSIFIGYNAGESAISASNSTFIGVNAGNGATNSNSSTFIGANAGYEAENALASTFIGYNAGNGATNASYSIFIGNNTGYIDTLDNTLNDGNSILIGNNLNSGGYKNSIILGNITGGSVSNTKNNQFLVPSSYLNWQIRGVDYVMPSTQGNPNSMLLNDGSGTLSWLDVNVSAVTGVTKINKLSVTAVTNATLTSAQHVVLVNTSAPRTITLPDSPIDGQVYHIKDKTGNALNNNIIIDGNGYDIDGSATASINTDYGSLYIVYSEDEGEWFTLAFIS